MHEENTDKSLVNYLQIAKQKISKEEGLNIILSSKTLRAFH